MRFDIIAIAMCFAIATAKPFTGEKTNLKRNPIQPVDPSPSCTCYVGPNKGNMGPSNECSCNSNDDGPSGGCGLCDL